MSTAESIGQAVDTFAAYLAAVMFGAGEGELFLHTVALAVVTVAATSAVLTVWATVRTIVRNVKG
jgi:hypothetical protein